MHFSPASNRQCPQAVIVVCALELACFACDGGQTGGEAMGGGAGAFPGSSAGCDEEVRGLLAIDDAEPLGFSGADVLATILERRSAPLLWSADTVPLSIGPEQGESSINLSIEYGGGSVSWIHFKPSGASADEPSTGDSGCSLDRLAIEVLVRLTTAGGAFDEQFSAEIEAPSTTYPFMQHELRLDSLTGSFRVDAPPGYSAPAVLVYASWDEKTFSGAFTGLVLDQRLPGTANTESPVSVIYATWPLPSKKQ